MRRGKLRKIDSRVPAETDLRGGRVAYLFIPPGDTFRSQIRVRTLRNKRSRVVVTGFASEGESYAVSSPVLTGRYIHWLQEDRMRNEFFAGRALAGPREAALEFTQRTFPGRVDSIAITRERFYYTNGKGLYLATDPPPIFAAARLESPASPTAR